MTDPHTPEFSTYGKAGESVRVMNENGWVIEREVSLNQVGAGPYYLTVERDMDFFDWTPDHLLAIRFARRQDAEMVARLLGDDVGAIVEHLWSKS